MPVNGRAWQSARMNRAGGCGHVVYEVMNIENGGDGYVRDDLRFPNACTEI
jgi:hypothetical protein